MTVCVHHRVSPLVTLLGADQVISLPHDPEKAEIKCKEIFNSEDSLFYDYTPLIYASHYGHSEVVELLLQHLLLHGPVQDRVGATSHRARAYGIKGSSSR